MAVTEEVFIGNRLVPIDQAQGEINKLEAAIAEQNRILNHLTTETSMSTVKSLRLQNDKAYEFIEAIAAVDQIAVSLGLTQNKDLGAILEAIADLKKHNLAHTNIIRQTEVALRIKEGSFSYVDGCGLISTLVLFRENILKALNISPSYYVTNDQTMALDAIANLKHSLQLSQNEVRELQEKTAIPESWKSEPISYFRSILDKLCDRLSLHRANGYELLDGCVSKLVDEVCEAKDLRSERDYYRGILDKLCDRLKAQDIEALEHVAKSQEMSLDFIDQHNDDLRKKLVESQAMSLKYMNRIVELEREVRSLQEPVNTVGCGDDHVDSLRYFVDACKPNALKNFDSDRLSNPELIQIIRSLLK
jgi:hypothetical protein